MLEDSYLSKGVGLLPSAVTGAGYKDQELPVNVCLSTAIALPL